MGRAIAVLLFTSVVCACAFASGIKEGSLSANSNGSSITVRWVSDNESGVIEFRIERRAGNTGSFVELTEIPVRGNGSVYEYVDNFVFRTSDNYYVYRVTAVGSNAEPWYVTARHITNGVKRTWGSIKAMFR